MGGVESVKFSITGKETEERWTCRFKCCKCLDNYAKQKLIHSDTPCLVLVSCSEGVTQVTAWPLFSQPLIIERRA